MIKPSNAASIWIIDDHIYLELPGTKIQSHTIRFKANEAGLTAAIKLLRERKEGSKIGSPGDHTQAQFNKSLERKATALLTRGKPVNRTRKSYRPELLDKAKDVLRDMGMIK